MTLLNFGKINNDSYKDYDELSRFHDSPSVNSPDAIDPAAHTELPVSDEIAKVREMVRQNWSTINGLDRVNTEKIRFFKGKHMRVFDHRDFPGRIFKATAESSIRSLVANVERCQQIVFQHHLTHCKIPACKMTPLEWVEAEYPQAILIMDKVDGIISVSVAEEESEKAFERFPDDPALEAKWKEWFRQAAEFICLSGYWDVSWSNVLLMEEGLGFVDFEAVFTQSNKGNETTGISRLFNMAPPQFFPMIQEIADKYQLLANRFFAAKDCLSAQKLRRELLATHSVVRKWHREKGVSAEVCTIDPNRWALQTWEHEITTKLKKQFDSFLQNSRHWGIPESAIYLRDVWIAPLNWPPPGLPPGIRAFEAALKNLQSNEMICTWTRDENHIYRIYF